MKTIHLSAAMLTSAMPPVTSNIQAVQLIFEKFGQGDVPGIIDLCSDDCEWHHGGDASLIPFATPFHGKQGVGEFFQSVVQSIAVSNIRPSGFRENGKVVTHDFHVEATVLATGKFYSADVLYEWTFDENGKICRHRSTGDFSAAEAAFRA